MSTVDTVVFVFILGLKIVLLQGNPTFFGKEPQPLLCSGMWAPSVKIIINGTCNCLIYFAILVIPTQLTSVTMGCLTKPWQAMGRTVMRYCKSSVESAS